ncbi:hypothetical protein IVB45_05835 [Bradyrhizobium sp. 4]|uniref:hypothetical protein n=1 Tax=unclassified Bradyrhizobium TaxID=2631580 RepID=UPI001FFB2BBA|nr:MULTISPECIES: hypothetical protein [unclassified Bradyrhizobium]MCK1403678.1 hypothetical protein [Bradyrhizobium sp. 39]MCK1634623.1 hypothetical protein [Bradyrhizobium sp. 162]MCK1751415.1 hypothetical protein [Bradyrhizobium sp. 135]UPJ36434.1 hypothetical protein IVB45_05835 [Bradyrhizobium sp. 4]
MTTKILALTDALGNLVRFVLLPGQRFDTVGVQPLIEELAFDALIADDACDSNAITAELDARGAQGHHLPASASSKASRHRQGDVQMAASHRELLRQAQAIQAHRMRADKTDQSFACDQSSRGRDKFQMNPNRPWVEIAGEGITV